MALSNKPGDDFQFAIEQMNVSEITETANERLIEENRKILGVVNQLNGSLVLKQTRLDRDEGYMPPEMRQRIEGEISYLRNQLLFYRIINLIFEAFINGEVEPQEILLKVKLIIAETDLDQSLVDEYFLHAWGQIVKKVNEFNQ